MKELVLKFLKKKPMGATPTEIGLGIGKGYQTASSSVTQPLKRLMKEGLVKRIIIDGKVKYYCN